jgi:hypothetical protein
MASKCFSLTVQSETDQFYVAYDLRSVSSIKRAIRSRNSGELHKWRSSDSVKIFSVEPRGVFTGN